MVIQIICNQTDCVFNDIGMTKTNINNREDQLYSNYCTHQNPSIASKEGNKLCISKEVKLKEKWEFESNVEPTTPRKEHCVYFGWFKGAKDDVAKCYNQNRIDAQCLAICKLFVSTH
jgi:hypothetical protein